MQGGGHGEGVVELGGVEGEVAAATAKLKELQEAEAKAEGTHTYVRPGLTCVRCLPSD